MRPSYIAVIYMDAIRQNAKQSLCHLLAIAMLLLVGIPAAFPVMAGAQAPMGKRADKEVQSDPLEVARFDVGGGVIAMALSGDGRILAVSLRSDKDSLQLRDLKTGDILATLAGHQGTVHDVAFSCDGELLASAGGDRVVKLWSIDAKSKVDTIEAHKSRVTAVAFSPNGSFLATGSQDWTVKVWDLRERAIIHSLDGHRPSCSVVAFSTDSKTLVSGGTDDTVHIWHVETGVRVKTLGPFTRGDISTATFSADGTALAIGSSDKRVRIWDTKDWQLLDEINCRAMVTAAAYLRDSRHLAVASGDGNLEIFDTSAHNRATQIFGHKSWISRLLNSPDGRWLISGSTDQTIRTWNVASFGK